MFCLERPFMDAQGTLVEAVSASPVGISPNGASPSMFDTVYPLTILILLGLAIPGALMSLNIVLSRWAHGEHNRNPGKDQPVESGLPLAVGGSGEKFSVKFYLIAMLFLAFDIEVAFLYPWAWWFKHGQWEMVWMLVFFLVLLEVGYLYLYKKGALDWE
jgi:NADH-quinone oxidoreductase subunit A